MLEQGNRTCFRDDDLARTTNLADPFPKLFGVRHGRGQRHNPRVLGQMNKHFFPDRATETIRKIVHFVEHNMTERTQACTHVNHVPQDFGGHDDDGCVRINRRIASEEAHSLLAITLLKICKLLIRKCLNRCCVEST